MKAKLNRKKRTILHVLTDNELNLETALTDLSKISSSGSQTTIHKQIKK